MKLVDVIGAFIEPRWSKEKLEEASRGKVNGACNDPFRVEFKYWLELSRDRARNNIEYGLAGIGVVIQAILGQIK